VPSACFPYTAANQPCNLCGSWNTQLTQISSWLSLTSQANMKAFIAQTGPMSACFTVYEDFYYHYSGGVYEYNAATSGNAVGGHCVCIVGYSDAGQYWICKNSWGPAWGESGYFRIGYGNCGIDAEMWGINGTVTSEVWHFPIPIRPIHPILPIEPIHPIIPGPITPGPIHPGPINPGPIAPVNPSPVAPVNPAPIVPPEPAAEPEGAAADAGHDPGTPQVDDGPANSEL
jgi:hypothetical protein